MILTESILSGIQKWQQVTAKNFLRSRARRRVALGKQLSALPRPETLGEAGVLLEQLIRLLPATEKKRARELLQAVKSAESREGVDSGSLVDSLLQGEITLEEGVQRRLGFSLGLRSP